jgi:hypothetical protein
VKKLAGTFERMVVEWSTGLALQLVKSGVDAIWFGDDLGPDFHSNST